MLCGPLKVVAWLAIPALLLAGSASPRPPGPRTTRSPAPAAATTRPQSPSPPGPTPSNVPAGSPRRDESGRRATGPGSKESDAPADPEGPARRPAATLAAGARPLAGPRRTSPETGRRTGPGRATGAGARAVRAGLGAGRPEGPRRRRPRAGLQRAIVRRLPRPRGHRRRGGVERNIEIVTATERRRPGARASPTRSAWTSARAGSSTGWGNAPGDLAAPGGPRPDPRVLAAIHPGFREARSVVLHRFGTDPAYHAWRGSVPGQHGAVVGPDLAAEPDPAVRLGPDRRDPRRGDRGGGEAEVPRLASVKGRVSRLKDGRVGRFGWKGQTATLQEFVLSAAAGEIGLEVPGHHQAADPRLPGLAAAGPGPGRKPNATPWSPTSAASPPRSPSRRPTTGRRRRSRPARTTFKAIGCAPCHLPKLGDVDGIYSDLLLHDMSPPARRHRRLLRLRRRPAAGADGPAAADGPGRDATGAGDGPRVADAAPCGASATPPLTSTTAGPRRSTRPSPSTAARARPRPRRFAELSPRRKRHLEAFLMSLAAPVGRLTTGTAPGSAGPPVSLCRARILMQACGSGPPRGGPSKKPIPRRFRGLRPGQGRGRGRGTRPAFREVWLFSVRPRANRDRGKTTMRTNLPGL